MKVGILSVMLIMGISFGCQKESTHEQESFNLDMQEFAKVAWIQAEGTKKVLMAINQKTSSGRTYSKAEILSFAKKATIEFIESLDLKAETENEAIEFVSKTYDNSIDMNAVKAQLNVTQKDYLERLNKIIENSKDIQTCFNGLDVFEKEVSIKLSNSDAFPLISAIYSIRSQMLLLNSTFSLSSINGRVMGCASWRGAGKAALGGALACFGRMWYSNDYLRPDWMDSMGCVYN